MSSYRVATESSTRRMPMNDRTRPLCVIALVLAAGLGSGMKAQAEDQVATIAIDLKAEKAPVPATLYGIFMEELSHAFDGGIYAELIQNRSFEEGVLPPGMQLITKPDGSLKMELQKL